MQASAGEAGAADVRRRERARRRGVQSVVSLNTPGATMPRDSTASFDATFCATEWLAADVQSRGFPRPVVLAPPVPAHEVVAAPREPLCTTLPPPSRNNGLYFLVRLAEQLSLARPDDPVLVLSSVGGTTLGESLIDSSRRAGFDLGQYPNIMVSDPAAAPAAT